MSARSWWGAKAGSKPAENRKEKSGSGDSSPDDLLDARFDEAGQLAPLGRSGRRRIPARLDPASAGADVDDLDLAVRKLTEGLEALERESRAAPKSEPAASADPGGSSGAADASGTRDFVTYSLDRLEARLEALSQRLQQKSASAPAAPPVVAEPAAPWVRPSEPPVATVPAADIEAQLAEARLLAEAEERRAAEAGAEEAEQVEAAERAHREAEEAAEALRQAEAAEARRQVEIGEARRLAEATEARRKAEVAEARRLAEAAELRRQAELAEARRQTEMVEARRKAELAAAAEEWQRQVEESETIRQADMAEARRRAEALEAKLREADEARRVAEIAAARRQAEQATVLERQFAIIEGRIDALQRGLDENQIDSVRGELLDLVQEMSDLSRSGRAASEGLDQIGTRLDEMEVKLHAARNIASNRLGDIQDRLSGLVERLDEIEVEIPGFDAIRENQGAILERFDRMEGLVQQVASPVELFERVESLKRQIQTVASEQGVMRVEAQVLKLADRIDALPNDLSDAESLQRIEGQLGMFASEFAEARRQRKAVATELDRHLAEIAAQIRDVGESGRTPDISSIETQLAALGARLSDDRQFGADAFAGFERRLGLLADAIETQETEILEGLTKKIDALASAIDAQDSSGTRRDIEALDGKLGQLSDQIATQSDHLTQEQMEPLKARLDDVQGQLEELARRAQDSSALFRPFLLKLQEISDRLSVLGAEGTQTPLAERLDTIEERVTGLSGKAQDPRALQTQLDGVISRLELLKGRSIDPGRLNDLFDRVDAAVRALPEDRFDRIEQKLAEAMIPLERLDRLEKKLGEGGSAISAERLSRLERRLEEIARIFGGGGELLTQEDMADLRADITALRRELRSTPAAGQGDAGLAEMVRTLAKRVERLDEEPPITAVDLEVQMDRIARLVDDDPSHNRMALAQIETSLRTIEKRLDQTRQALAQGGQNTEAAETEETEAIARALTDDVTALRSSAEQSEKKTRDAIDAVQDTLEAVVKRMAFLERDVDKADKTEPAAAEPEALSRAPKAPEPRAAQSHPEDLPPASLLSRLTSRQLLKRATGGRAESFSPGPEDSDDGSDFPLEPGTDAPLASALADAPSSDTEFMSGARKSRLTPSFGADAQRSDASTGASDHPVVDDDFLAAARRAARAASAEVSESEHRPAFVRSTAGLGRIFTVGRRRALLGAVLAAVLVIAAVQIVRLQLLPVEPEIAALPDASAPAATPEPLSAPASSPTASVPDTAPADLRPEETESAATEEPAADVSAPPATALAPAIAPESTPDAAATTEAPAAEPQMEVATAPSEPEEAQTPLESMQPQLAALPLAIGPDRLREAAMAGDAIAAFEVAARYAEGRGVAPDMRAAVAWYERSGGAGLAPAQYRLGSIFEKGTGVPRDLAAAQDWYRRAADAGNVKAMHNLAVLYAEGAGGTPDLERASALFRQAAEHGVRDSQFNLAILHARGLGVPQDLIEAYKWFAIAATSGDEESIKRRDIIAAALSESDLATAKAAAASFQPAPLIAEANEVQMPDDGWGEDNSNVEVKSDNELVALIQKLLAENGYDPGPPDGLLGEKTIEALSAFQGKAGLPQTGQIDEKTMAALQAPST